MNPNERDLLSALVTIFTATIGLVFLAAGQSYQPGPRSQRSLEAAYSRPVSSSSPSMSNCMVSEFVAFDRREVFDRLFLGP